MRVGFGSLLVHIESALESDSVATLQLATVKRTVNAHCDSIIN